MLDAVAVDLPSFFDREYRRRYGPRAGRGARYAEIFRTYVGLQDSRLALLRPYLSEESSVLDVGCSTGHLLYRLKPFVRDVTGVDYDRRAARFAARVLGAPVHGCGLMDANLLHDSFELVCSVDTMQHTDDPVSFVESLVRHVAPHGIVYIEVPNLNDALLSIYENADYRRFYFRDSHLLYFTVHSLATIAHQAGLEGSVHFLQHYNTLNHLRWVLCGAPSHLGSNSGVVAPVVARRRSLAADAVNQWLQESDAVYRDLLGRYGATDAIAFIGRSSDSAPR